MRARILATLVAILFGACAPVLAQPPVNASQLRLGVIGTAVCTTRTGTGAPSPRAHPPPSLPPPPPPPFLLFFFNDTATTEIYTLSLHDALPI